MSAAVYHDPVNAPAAVLSVLVHIALFAFLFFGVRWHSRLPDAVVVELWDRLPGLEQPAPVAPPKPLPRVEPKPEPKVEAKVEVKPEPKPKIEVKPVKPDIAVEKEKKPPPKKEPKKQPKKQPKKVEPTISKFDRSPEFQKEVARDLEQVARTRKPFQPPATGPKADASYMNKIRTKIRSNIVLPLGITGNPEAIFDVVQLPTGEVLSARLRKSSGNRAYDEAVERAILKSSPLPRPDPPDQVERDLQLKFRPVDAVE